LTTRRALRSRLFPSTTLFRSARIVFRKRRIRVDAVLDLLGNAEDLGVRQAFRLELGEAELAAHQPGGDGERDRELGVVTVLRPRSEEHTSELQSREKLVCRLL